MDGLLASFTVCPAESLTALIEASNTLQMLFSFLWVIAIAGFRHNFPLKPNPDQFILFKLYTKSSLDSPVKRDSYFFLLLLFFLD